MIMKKGKKTDRTVMMENIVSTWFENMFSIELIPEYPVETGGVADFFGIVGDAKSPEDVIIVELKQSAQDFYSGHGLNFVGSSNYLAVPSELVGFAIEFLRDEDMEHVGVLEVTNDAFVRLVTYPRPYRENIYINIGFPNEMFDPVHMRNNNKIMPKWVKRCSTHGIAS